MQNRNGSKYGAHVDPLTVHGAGATPVYTIGIDFGTESGRVLLLEAATGVELGVRVVNYTSGVIDRVLPESDEPLPPDWALQDPADWVTVLETGIPALLPTPTCRRHAWSASASTSPPARSFPSPRRACRCARCHAGGLAATPGPSCGSITPPSVSRTVSTTSRSSDARTSYPATAGASPRSGTSPS